MYRCRVQKEYVGSTRHCKDRSLLVKRKNPPSPHVLVRPNEVVVEPGQVVVDGVLLWWSFFLSDTLSAPASFHPSAPLFWSPSWGSPWCPCSAATPLPVFRTPRSSSRTMPSSPEAGSSRSRTGSASLCSACGFAVVGAAGDERPAIGGLIN